MTARADVIVVGAGILGLAVARELLLGEPRLTLLVLEKEERIAAHQTGHNSGVVHSGIYYAPGSRKAKFCVAGARRLYEYCDEHGIEYERCGKVIVATSPEEVPRLEELHRRALANGVADVERIGRERLAELEPHTAGVEALYAPATGIVDFTRVAHALADDVRSLGGEIRTGHAVTGIDPGRSSSVAVETNGERLDARFLVTCAGLHSDRLAKLTGAPGSPKIVPFRGSYKVLRPEAESLVRGLVYPVPDPAFPFLGVHFTKQISGRVWAGPNAVLAFAREGYRKRDVRLRDLWETLSYRGFRALARRHWRTGLVETRGEFSKRAFAAELRKLVPDIEPGHLAPGPAGVRAQALSEQGELLDDFWLDEAERVTHVRNAPSPGATSSLALGKSIAEHVRGRLEPVTRA